MGTTEEIVNRSVLRFKTVLVIDENGQQLGVMPAAAGLGIAENRDLDFVCVAPDVPTPVCRIMDYGKYRYEQEKKRKLAKKNAVKTEVKEIQIKAGIADHDMQIKAKHIKEFLEEGNIVRIVMRLRGREISLLDFAKEKFQRFLGYCGEYSTRKELYLEGRDLQTVIERKKN